MKKGIAFLKRATELERKINTAMRRMELCKSMSQRITPSLGDHVSHTRNVKANEEAMIRAIEAEEELKHLTAQYEKVVSEILAMLSRMGNPAHEKILEDHYLKRESFETIASKGRVSVSCIYKRHSRAREELETLLPP